MVFKSVSNITEFQKRFNRLESNFKTAKLNLTMAKIVETYTSNRSEIETIRDVIKHKDMVTKYRTLLKELVDDNDLDWTFEGIEHLRCFLNRDPYSTTNLNLHSQLTDLENKCKSELHYVERMEILLDELDDDCEKFLSKGFNRFIFYIFKWFSI